MRWCEHAIMKPGCNGALLLLLDLLLLFSEFVVVVGYAGQQSSVSELFCRSGALWVGAGAGAGAGVGT